MANTEMIDQLVSPQALKDLDTLDKKLMSSYQEMEKTLLVVQNLVGGIDELSKSYRDVVKYIDKSVNAQKQATKTIQDAIGVEEERKKYLESIIYLESDHTKELETQQKAAKKLEMTTKQLLSTAKETAKGIDMSAYIKQNEDGMVNYSNAINATNEQLGRIQGLQELLKEEFNQGKISEAEYSNVVAELTQRQTEYGATLASLQKKYEDAKEAQKQVFNPDSSAFDKLSSDVQEQTYLLVGMNAELNETRNSQTELDKAYKDGDVTLGEYITKKAQLNAQETELSNAVGNLSKELQLNDQIANTAIGSYDNLSARYSLMKIQINAMGEAEEQNVKQKRALEKEAQALYKQMNQLQQATGKSKLQAGKYAIINKELTGALSTLSPALGGTVTRIQAMTSAAMKFIATPIGAVIAAIVVVLKLLSTWFTRTEKGQNALAVATAVFEKVLNAILNVADKVGEWIYNAFTSPKEAIKELGDMIVTNVMNRLNALTKIGRAVAKIFSEDWKQGFIDLGSAAAQALTGIDDPLAKINKGVNDLLDGVERASEIQSKLNDLSTKKRQLNVDEAKSQAELNRLQDIANDQDKSAAQRLAANNKYIEISNKLGEQRVNIAKEEYQLRKAQIYENKGITDKMPEQEIKGKLSTEENNELAKLEADMYKVAADHQQNLSTSIRTNNRLRKEGANAEEDATEKKKKELKTLGEIESLNFRKSADIQQQLSKDSTLTYDERKTALRAYIDDEISIIKTKEEEELNQEELTENQSNLIKDKALYEIYKLEQKYNEEIKNLNQEEAEDKVKKTQEGIDAKRDKLNEAMQKELVDAANNYKEQIAQNVNNEKKRTEITEEYQKSKLEIIRKYNQAAFDFEVEQLEKSLDNTELTEEQKLNIQKKIDELKKKNAKEMADFEINETEGKVDKMLSAEEKFNKVMSDTRIKSLQAMWSMALDMATMYYDEQLKQIDALEKREKEYWDDKTKQIDENLSAGLMSQEEADAKKRIIEETQMEREKKYEQQRKEIERKKAVWDKANSIMQATIAGAQAVVVAYTAGPIIGPILASIVGAMAAAQIAMMASQQIPAYAKGTDAHPGGLARVGDAGRSEMVILPSGEVWKTPATDTLVHLPRGTEVLPDYKKAMMAMSSQPYVSYYDDDSGKMIFLNDEVLRNNTKEANNQLNSINKGINAIRYNNIYSGRKNNTGYRFGNNLFH